MNSHDRLAHPGGPVATNKAAALAKFLERKLKDPNGLASINPDLLELAVNNAKQTVYASNICNSLYLFPFWKSENPVLCALDYLLFIHSLSYI